MKKIAHIVVGLGYGDEGKGASTNHLCKISHNPIVIRFNGGHQAGHTVVLPTGKRHIFSNFGSGTLLSIPTYWSKYCTISPAHLLSEYHSLEIIPKLFIDNSCPVTTHYDILYNRALEITKGKNRIGSCGMGFGATIDRHLKHQLEFKFGDLLDAHLVVKKLETIRKFYEYKINTETKFEFDAFDHDTADNDFKEDIYELAALIERNVIKPSDEKEIFTNNDWTTFIFEGAQGILLDQSFGHQPYITKSNTSSKNAIDILNRYFEHDSGKLEINIHYISRAYLTRHGAGHFPLQSCQLKLTNIENETNQYNDYQGSFRTGHLCIELINYSLECDNKFSSACTKHLIITCLDQMVGHKLIVSNNNIVEPLEFDELRPLLKCRFKSIKFFFDPQMSNYLIKLYP